MKSIYYTVPAIALLAGLLVGAYWFAQNIALGSVVQGNDYQSVQLTSSDVGTTSLRTLAGSVGSIVVASSSNAGAVNLYRISSTTDPTATSSNTLIFSFPANTDEGTYQFDVEYAGGLFIDVEPTFSGNYIMTYR